MAEKSGGSQVSQRSKSPRLLTARASFLVLALVAVALATSTAPTAKIVINVPANIVKNGSKIFFNKDFHGRLLLSEGLKGRIQEFQQFGKLGFQVQNMIHLVAVPWLQVLNLFVRS